MASCIYKDGRGLVCTNRDQVENETCTTLRLSFEVAWIFDMIEFVSPMMDLRIVEWVIANNRGLRA